MSDHPDPTLDEYAYGYRLDRDPQSVSPWRVMARDGTGEYVESYWAGNERGKALARLVELRAAAKADGVPVGPK